MWEGFGTPIYKKMRTFGTYGPVNPEDNYVVSRTEELTDFIKRVKLGRCIVIFAPRQTGKTTFFQWALDALAADASETYFPIELNFEVYEGYPASDFYASLYQTIYEEIARVFEKRGTVPSEDLSQFLEKHETDRSYCNAPILSKVRGFSRR